MVQHILCVIAGQRSGTTAFRSLLSGTGRFADLGEIFDTSTIGQSESFYGYCREHDVRFTDVISGPTTERLCKTYMSVLREIAADKHLLIDVKFNSWGTIRMPWAYLHQEPYFLTHLKSQRARFIFVWRRDIAAQVMSDRISSRIGKWHNISSKEVGEPFGLDLKEISERAKLLCLSEGYFFDVLNNYAHKLVLCYEDLFTRENFLSRRVLAAVSEFFDERLILSDLALYKQNEIDKSRLVKNYYEISAAVEEVAAVWRTPFLSKVLRA